MATAYSVSDGGSIRICLSGKALTVRLACIDAPENAQPPLRPEVTHVFAVAPTDRYGRSVAEVISGVNINLALVEDGQAFAYRQYLSGCNAKEYLDAEYRANRRRYGV